MMKKKRKRKEKDNEKTVGEIKERIKDGGKENDEIEKERRKR